MNLPQDGRIRILVLNNNKYSESVQKIGYDFQPLSFFEVEASQPAIYKTLKFLLQFCVK